MVIDLTGTTSHSMTRGKVSSQQNAGADKSATPAQSTGSKDTFELSDTAKALKNADTIIANTPETNSDKVAQLKAAIGDGSYSINFQSTAQKLLSLEGQLN